MSAPLRLGTRGSTLAMRQSNLVADLLRRLGTEVELVQIVTAGDVRPPDTAWGEGAFVGALEAALLAGEIDLAVHSAKDVPIVAEDDLVIAAYPGRADPRDALVTRSGASGLHSLAAGSTIGTDSPRRTGFILAARPDLHVIPLHGNVDSRLARLDRGEVDALVLAVAGLERLDRADRTGARLSPDVVPPAPGQGALAVQVRADDPERRELVGRLDDADTRLAVTAEREVLRRTGGGCRAPLGALAEIGDGTMRLLAGVVEPSGSGAVFAERNGPVSLAMAFAAELAEELVADRRAGSVATPGPGRPMMAPPVILVTRPDGEADPIVGALRAAGYAVAAVPTVATRLVAPGGPLDEAVARLDSWDWVVITSRTGVRAIADAAARIGRPIAETGPGKAGTSQRHPRWAAVGSVTAAALAAIGLRAEVVPAEANGRAIARALAGAGPMAAARVLLARADAASPDLRIELESLGASVDEVVAYHTIEGPESAIGPLSALFGSSMPAAVVFGSGSAARGLLALAGRAGASDRVLQLPVAAIGPSTAAVARSLGFELVHQATEPSVAGLVAAVTSLVAVPSTPAPVPLDHEPVEVPS